MSEHNTRLVEDGSGAADAALDFLVGLSVVSFVVALLAMVEVLPLAGSGPALVGPLLTLSAVVAGAVGTVALGVATNVVPTVSRRARGVALGAVVAALGLPALAWLSSVTLATLLGGSLVVLAAGVAAAGVASRLGALASSPDDSAGLLAGVVFGVVGLFVGAALGGTLFGFGFSTGLVALAAAAGLFVLTVVPREEIGSTLPPALVLGVLGLTIGTAAIGVGWEWNPTAVSGGFTGGAVIPLFVIFGAILSAWASAKARVGFGAQGRQYGAFLVIDLNAALMVAAMVAIVAFVTLKGAGYALHGLTVGALALLVALLPPLFVAVRFAGSPAGAANWHAGVRQLVRFAPLAAVGGVAAAALSVLATGSPLAYPFTYTVQVNREPRVLDTAVSLTPEPVVGAVLLSVTAGVSALALSRRYNSLRGAAGPNWVSGARKTVSVAVLSLLAVTMSFALAGTTPFGLPLGATLGFALVGAAAAATVALVATSLLVSVRDPATSALPLGVFGGLALLSAATLLQPVAGIAPLAGPVHVVPVAALAAGVLSLSVAALAVRARRGTEETAARRRFGDAATLGLLGTAGFAMLLGLHVRLTGSSFVLGSLTVSTGGAVSWPMTMQTYIPLGAEPGGIMPAVVGTVWLVVGATLFAVPLGVGAAVFLTEYAEQSGFTALVEVATNALWSTPSVVFGLFGAAFLIPRLGGDTSLLAGMLVLGFMLLPLVLITSREAIKAVPDEYRDASAALGVTKWQTVRSVVLPAAMPGVITGGILGVGRVAGETAPLILVLGSTLNPTESVHVLRGFRFVSHPPFVVNDQLLSASASLPTQVWAVIAAGVSGSPSMGWATAFVLLGVVLSFYTVGIAARTYFRRKISHE